MAREKQGRGKQGGRGERDAARQSDREEQYGGLQDDGMNEPGRGFGGQQRYAGGGYGQGQEGSDWQGQSNWQDQQYGGSGSRGQGFGTGGAQQQHDPGFGRQFGGGPIGEGRGETWGTGGHGSGSFGQSASGQGRNFGQGDYYQGQDYGDRFGQSGRSGQAGRYGQQGYGQQGFQGGFEQQGIGSGFGSESGRGYESGRQMGYVGRGPKGYRRSDDRIREDVSEELTQHPGIDASDIEVRVENGEVTLTGTVESRQAKRMAEDCVDRCSGVKEVHNQLRVNRQGSQQGSTQGSLQDSSQGAGQSEGRKQGSEESRSRSSPARGRQ
ncbi:MAG TPA: BON domain-containing protein [Gemmatimonadales bacterium]